MRKNLLGEIGIGTLKVVVLWWVNRVGELTSLNSSIKGLWLYATFLRREGETDLDQKTVANAF